MNIAAAARTWFLNLIKALLLMLNAPLARRGCYHENEASGETKRAQIWVGTDP
jgi:hypothetical protein